MSVDNTLTLPKRLRGRAAPRAAAQDAWTPLGRSDDLALQVRSPTVTLLDRLYVFGGRDDIAVAAAASDDGGNTWETVEGQGGYLPVLYPATTAFDGWLRLVGGEDPTGSLTQTARSTDASLWSLDSSVAQWGQRRGARVIGFNGRLHLIGGGHEGTVFGDVWRFDPDPGGDYSTWNRIASIPPRIGHAVGSVAGTLVVMGGVDDQGQPGDVLTSLDGITWTASAAPFGARTQAAAVTLCDVLYLIGGSGEEHPENDVWATRDGVTWTQALTEAPFHGIVGHGAAAVGDHIVVAGGFIGGRPNDQAWALTPPGVGWTELEPDAGSSGAAAPDTGFLNGKYWAWCGSSAVSSREVRVSDDGRRWTRVTQVQAMPERQGTGGVAHHGKLFACGGANAQGPSNEVYVSTDGASWVQVAGSRRFDASFWRPCVVSFQDKLWLFGSDTHVWCSQDDGVNWDKAKADAFPTAPQEPRAAVFRDQIWMVDANDREVWFSTTGSDWTKVQQTPGFSSRSAFGLQAVGERLYLVRGTIGRNKGAQDVWASTDGRDWRKIGDGAPYDTLISFGVVTVGEAIMLFGGYEGQGGHSSHILRYVPPPLPPRP